ncbi:MAG TPA: nitrilase-related carbon-nitrogen hydrolase [Bacteroidota bacterium]|nr:nitrilase-related carbon-nitrogen hydrolase [Bacteroidota bacterium]
MDTVRVGLCTGLGPLSEGDLAARLGGPDILLFPELVDGGYARLKSGGEPHRAGDPLLRQFSAASRTVAPACIAGSVFLLQGSPAPANASLVFQGGRVIHRYDKIHLFRPTGDHLYFRAGSRIRTFRLRAGRSTLRCGVIICYDLRFPELARAMTRMGMDILFIPARWPAARDDAWQTLLKARAIENQVFVVGCNAGGEEGGWSYAFDPTGVKIFDSHDAPGDEAHALALDLGRIDEALRLHRGLAEAVVLRSSPLRRRVTARRGRAR